MFTQSEALTRALVLAILAATDDNEKRATDLADELARGLTSEQVAQAKRDAQQMIRQALYQGANQ